MKFKMVYKIKTYHDEVRRKYGLSTGILGKRAATLSLEERAGGTDSGFFFRGSQMSFSEKLQVSSITLALVSHLSKFIFKLSNSLAGHLAATPLCSFGSLANGQILSAKTGHARFNWVRVTEAGY